MQYPAKEMQNIAINASRRKQKEGTQWCVRRFGPNLPRFVATMRGRNIISNRHPKPLPSATKKQIFSIPHKGQKSRAIPFRKQNATKTTTTTRPDLNEIVEPDQDSTSDKIHSTKKVDQPRSGKQNTKRKN